MGPLADCAAGGDATGGKIPALNGGFSRWDNFPLPRGKLPEGNFSGNLCHGTAAFLRMEES